MNEVSHAVWGIVLVLLIVVFLVLLYRYNHYKCCHCGKPWKVHYTEKSPGSYIQQERHCDACGRRDENLWTGDALGPTGWRPKNKKR